MKKTVSIFLALALCISAFGQNRPTNWFIGGGGGMNFGFDGQKYESREGSHNGVGTAVDFYVGKFFNDLIGFRTGYQGLAISNQYTIYGKTPFNYGHADFLLRLANWVTPYVHAGFALLDKGTPAGGVGVMLNVPISKRVSIVPDIKATAMNAAAFTGGENRLGANLSGTIGFKITLGKILENIVDEPQVLVPIDEPAPEPEPEPEPVVVEEPVIPEQVVEEVKVKEETLNRMISESVHVPTDVFVLSNESKEILDKVADIILNEILTVAPKAKVRVEGHTDNTGTTEHNQTLSENRAKSVVDYLIEKGIPAESIYSAGFGESHPIDTNDTAEGRAQNRRTEVRIGEL